MAPRDVILVAARVDDAIDSRQPFRARKQAERGIDDCGLFTSGDKERVALRVPAASLAEQHGHGSEGQRFQIDRHRAVAIHEDSSSVDDPTLRAAECRDHI
jgi:hypothetical protein